MKKCVEKECDKYDEAEANNCRTFVDIEIASQGQCRKMKKDAVANFQCIDGLWRTMDTAPKDMTEIMGWREDAGVMLIRYAAPIDFLTESELEEIGEEAAEAADWFYADFVQGGRLEGSEAPTHWMPLPGAP